MSTLLRLCVALKPHELDAALAGGADPDSDPALALRAERLTEPATREALAGTIQNLIDAAEEPPSAWRGGDPRPPPRTSPPASAGDPPPLDGSTREKWSEPAKGRGARARFEPVQSRRDLFNPSALERYIRSAVLPRFMQRLREIEDEILHQRCLLERAYEELRQACRDDPDLFAARWRETAAAWRFDELNELI